ncbi:hypothetical protein V6N12_047870 [Hibiscus sabdariffa]|uniref:Uncharacterized protein n=1 Tax=Hibiscus sabdariffa TaxID=183260 RepID=A0ABR2CWR3_9ROSI
MGRAPCCDKANVKRGPWSPEEDATLKNYVQTHGTGGNWIALPLKADQTSNMEVLPRRKTTLSALSIVKWEAGKWSVIASQLPGRTDNDVKNYWNTKLKKKVLAGKLSSFNSDNNGGLVNAAQTPEAAAVVSLPYYSTPLPIPSDVGYGFSVSCSTSTPSPLPVLSPSCPNLDNIVVVSSSQHGPAVSDSAGNGYVEDTGSILVDDHHHQQQHQQFSFEFPYEFINGGIGVPSLVDFPHADIKVTEGLSQNVVNRY